MRPLRQRGALALWLSVALALGAGVMGTVGGWMLRDTIADRAEAESREVIATAREEALHAALVDQANAARQALAKADAARRDARAAGAAADGLRKRAADLAARCSAESNDAAGGAGDLLADMLSRMEAHGRELAEYADAARIAGQQCDAVSGATP